MANKSVEWTCGHAEGSCCRVCYSQLAKAAHIFAEVTDDLLSALREIKTKDANAAVKAAEIRLTDVLNLEPF